MINEQAQTLIRSLFNASKSSTRRAVKSAISKEFKTGGVFSSYKNFDEVLLALRNRSLSAAQKNFLFKTIFQKTTDPKLLEDYSKILFKSKRFINKYSQVSETAFKNDLKSKGFSDNQVDVIAQTWKKEGYSFNKGKTSSTVKNPNASKILSKLNKSPFFKTAPESLKSSFKAGLRQKGVARLYWDALTFPINIAGDLFTLSLGRMFKRITSKESQRLYMWLASGVPKAPKDILQILKKEGLLPLAAETVGASVRRFLVVSAFLTGVNAVYNVYLERIGEKEKEYMDDRNALLLFLYRLWDNPKYAKLTHIFPYKIFWNYIIPSINIPLSDILSSRGLSLKTIDALKHKFGLVDVENLPESLIKAAGTLVGDIDYENGNYFLGYERLPIKSYQKTWVVKINGQWYKLSEIEKK